MNEYVHCTGVYIFQGDFMISGRGGELKMVHQKAIFFILLKGEPKKTTQNGFFGLLPRKSI